MSFKTTILAVAAVGALTAATAVPAMALENEFHGMYKMKYFVSNLDNGSNGYMYEGSGTGQAVRGTGVSAANYFEQRARLFYSAKANDDLKLVLGFEIDSVFGDRSQGSIFSASGGAASGAAATGAAAPGTTFRNSGGALDTDAVNLETKWVYLDFKIPSTPINVKTGIMPFKDSLKGIFADFDAAGVLTTTKLGAATLNVGYFRGYDQSYFATGTSSLPKGNENLDIGAIELNYAVNKNINAGLVYYIYADGRPNYYYPSGFPYSATLTTPTLTGLNNSSNGLSINSPNSVATMLHTFGLTADAKVGPVTLSGFAAYQGGTIRLPAGNSDYLNAYAANVAAKAYVGPGTMRSAFLMTSGNDLNASNGTSRHLTGWIGTTQSPDGYWGGNANGTSTYNESGMMLLNRNAASQGTTTDNNLVYNPGNGTSPLNMQGLYLCTVGYDMGITPKLSTSVNAGVAWAAHSNALKPTDKSTSAPNGTNFMGTEVNIEAGYKMYDNLTAKIQAAYVILGGYYKGASTVGTTGNGRDPEDPYTARFVLSYLF